MAPVVLDFLAGRIPSPNIVKVSTLLHFGFFLNFVLKTAINGQVLATFPRVCVPDFGSPPLQKYPCTLCHF